RKIKKFLPLPSIQDLPLRMQPLLFRVAPRQLRSVDRFPRRPRIWTDSHEVGIGSESSKRLFPFREFVVQEKSYARESGHHGLGAGRLDGSDLCRTGQSAAVGL